MPSHTSAVRRYPLSEAAVNGLADNGRRRTANEVKAAGGEPDEGACEIRLDSVSPVRICGLYDGAEHIPATPRGSVKLYVETMDAVLVDFDHEGRVRFEQEDWSSPSLQETRAILYSARNEIDRLTELIDSLEHRSAR